MSTEVRTSGDELIATFNEYSDAVRCLPAMARILREVLQIENPIVGKTIEPLPRGCEADSNAYTGKLVKITARP